MTTWKWGYWIACGSDRRVFSKHADAGESEVLAQANYGDLNDGNYGHENILDAQTDPTGRAWVSASPLDKQFIADACNEKREREANYLRVRKSDGWMLYGELPAWSWFDDKGEFHPPVPGATLTLVDFASMADPKTEITDADMAQIVKNMAIQQENATVTTSGAGYHALQFKPIHHMMERYDRP